MFRKKEEPPIASRRQAAPVARPSSFNYHANRSVVSFNTGRKEDVTPRQIYSKGLRNLPVVLSVLVMLSALFYATTLSASPKVVIDTDSKLRRPAAVYQDGIGEILGSSVLHYSKITINTDDVAKSVEQKYAELQDVAVTIPLIGRRPIVQATITRPAYIITTGDKSYYVRSDGVAMAAVSDVGQIDVPVILDLSDLPITPGKSALTSASSEFITELLGQLAAQKITPDSIVLPTIPNELQIKPANKNYRVKFNLLGDAREQAGAFLAVSDQLNREGITPKEYIDVRVEERAFYK